MPNHGGLAGCQGSSRKNYNQEQTTYPSNLDYKYTVPNYSTRVHNLFGYPRWSLSWGGDEQGKSDGSRGLSHGSGYDDSCDYYDYFETRYEEGYEEGDNEGSSEFEGEDDEEDE